METKSKKIGKRRQPSKRKSTNYEKIGIESLETLNKILPYYPLSPGVTNIDESNPPDLVELELLIHRIKCFIKEKEDSQKDILIKKEREKEQHDTRLKLLHFDKGYMNTKLAIIEKENKRLLKKIPKKKIKEEKSSLPSVSFYINKGETDDDLNYSSFHSPPPSPSRTQVDNHSMNSQRTLTNYNDNVDNIIKHEYIKQKDSNMMINPEHFDHVNNNNNNNNNTTTTNLPRDPLKRIQPFKFTFSPLRYGLSKKHNPSSSSSSSSS